MSIQFATTIYGTDYLPYLGACIASIDHIYGNQVQIIVGYFDIPKQIVSAIEQAYPQVTFHAFPPLPTGASRQARVALNPKMWAQLMKIRSTAHVVLLDNDTIVLKDMEPLFDDKTDVVFTHKTSERENMSWPVNGGVMLARQTEGAQWFFGEYAKLTSIISLNSRVARHARHHWGAEAQGATGWLLGRKSPEDFSRSQKIYGRLFPHHALGRQVKCVVRGIPCAIANETTCTPITPSTHLIHYKGRWREVIPDGTFTKHRPAEDCQEMFDLWQLNVKRWQERIPSF